MTSDSNQRAKDLVKPGAAVRTMPGWKLGFAKLVAAPWLFLLGPTRVFGRKNLPREGGVLLLSNHLSSLDPILIQWACRRHVIFMAEEELFDLGPTRWITKAWQCFSVKQDAPDRAALRRAGELLAQGHVVCVFPEGGLSPGLELAPLKKGVALIAKHWDGPVMACRIEGSRRVIPYGSMTPRPAFGWITVRLFTADQPPQKIRSHAESFLAWLRERILST